MGNMTYYITTPIYYVNDRPHIGHAYSTVVADAIARFHRIRGRSVRLSTGLDEHGTKIERRAREKGVHPQYFVNDAAYPFINAWSRLSISNDYWIRTSSFNHQRLVRRFWKMLVDAGDIYKGHYKDWYCVGCESFKSQRELVDGACSIHKKPVEMVEEETYFFRLSKYQQRLLDFFEANPEFVKPESRYNEIKYFVKEGLEDLSVTRTSFSWGVPVPDDSDHTMWVWIDALPNYITALGGPADVGESEDFDKFWPNGNGQKVVHIVGKDIIRFHAVYWPALLMSAGLQMPTNIIAHGWLTVNGEKMSKSLGNFLSPDPLINEVGADAVRYSLLRGVSFGNDGDFSQRSMIETHYNGELGNGIGNLLNRILPFVTKHFSGKIPDASNQSPTSNDLAFRNSAELAYKEVANFWENMEISRAIDATLALVDCANKYVNEERPWSLAKLDMIDRLASVCCNVMGILESLSIMLAPIMPYKCCDIRLQLGLGLGPLPLAGIEDSDAWPVTFSSPKPGLTINTGPQLFPRIG